MQMNLTKPRAQEKPIRSMSDPRLDFAHATPLRKSYIIASSPRSGSTFLSRSLALTGLMGAPSEVLNPGYDLRFLKNRFRATSPADYIAKVVAHRTSRNGVFGMKVHFQNFEVFLAEYPPLLDVLAPVTFIYLTREDKVAQGVSMARALLTDQWSSRVKRGERPPLQYDRELIENCLKEVALQDAGWRQWFEKHNVARFELTYENLIADPAATIASILELLGVQDDEPDLVEVPQIEKQGDDTSIEWIGRFARETQARRDDCNADVAGANGGEAAVDGGSEVPASDRHFFDRHERLIGNLPKVRDSATGFVDLIRLRHRYNAMVWQNRELFPNARVLDIRSNDGFWTLAALDAGAAFVLGLETSTAAVEAAAKNLSEAGAKPDSYGFSQANLFAFLRALDPEQFDVILCKRVFEYCNLADLFQHLSRLRPKHVIVDTKVAPGKGSFARFAIARRAWEGRKGSITSTPTHKLITFLSEPAFQWRQIDWRAIGVTDWAGIPDYERGTQRTYVFDLRE